MSRITRGRIVDGDTLNAASLNDRFDDYTQTDLNGFNLRDGALDLAHFTNARFLAPEQFSAIIGNNDWTHTSTNTVTGQSTGASPYVTQNASSTDTVLSFGAGGVTVSPGEVLRVYWDLSVRPRWEGSQPWLADAYLKYTFQDTSGSNVEVANGFGCWAFWLQWDTTSNALTNFANVPGQGTFNTVVVSTRGGNQLDDCQSTSIVPTVHETFISPEDGEATNSSPNKREAVVGWTAADGAWHYLEPGAGTTVYGLRVVFSGPFGAYTDGTDNYLVRADDAAAAARLDYNGGALQALLMRTK